MTSSFFYGFFELHHSIVKILFHSSYSIGEALPAAVLAGHPNNVQHPGNPLKPVKDFL